MSYQKSVATVGIGGAFAMYPPSVYSSRSSLLNRGDLGTYPAADRRIACVEGLAIPS